ncbi:uncharacterized protein LOC125372090 [Haliotis rufescens]|uniref:uncharacterized protein LOC125372090 n=1 Tax=Haliotis rufescens TaxID=6454 RepID=UPI00201F3F24|nr:uncharacterized protein LOC125372090 [Haliotis rufescens]
MLIVGLAMLQTLLAGQGDTYRYISKKGNYTQGRQYCQAYSLDLATVASKHDLKFIKTTYFPTRTSLFWLGAHYNGTSFIWPGGAPVLHANWGHNEPNDLETDHCVAVSSGMLTLYTRKCEESHPSMCGKNVLMVESASCDGEVKIGGQVCPVTSVDGESASCDGEVKIGETTENRDGTDSLKQRIAVVKEEYQDSVLTLCGDMTSRTGNLNDFTEDDSVDRLPMEEDISCPVE